MERVASAPEEVFVGDPAELCGRALKTMREVSEALHDLPDPDGALATLIERIEAERAWVAPELRLGVPPQQPPRWLVRVGS